MKKKISLLSMAFSLVLLFAFAPRTTDQKPWPVPEDAKNKVNPKKSDAASIANGKNVFNLQCKSCHGAKGKGDGPKASTLDTECGDFTKAAVQAETDGSLFYKISEGRKDMPSFKKKIPDQNDIWAVVNFLRTLK
jgi:mono/diheme cytochrome c family protein